MSDAGMMASYAENSRLIKRITLIGFLNGDGI
jgi:hypothetical protein